MGPGRRDLLPIPFSRLFRTPRARLFRLFVLAISPVLANCGGESPVGSAVGSQTVVTTGNSLNQNTTGSTSTAKSPAAKKLLGEPCTADSDCKSQLCKSAMPNNPNSAGICSECRSDQDCQNSGVGLGCLFVKRSGFFTCTAGYIGDTCENNGHCEEGLLCALLNLGDNESTEKVCSQCANHLDCPAEDRRNCIARYNPTGMMYNQCLPDGSRQKGEICFPCSTGNRECDGVCAVAHNKNTETEGLCIGVCGDCESDKDCPEGQICIPPLLDFDNLEKDPPHTPSRCAPPQSI